MLESAGYLATAPSLSIPSGAAARSRLVLKWSLAVTALLLVVLGAALATNLTGGRSTSSLAVRSHRLSRQGIQSLPLAAQGPVSTVLGAEGKAYRISRSEGGFRASSPTQHLSASFTNSGVSVVSGTTHLGLSLRAVGYGSSLTPLARVPPQAHANRVTYAHRSLSEWYTNGPLGLEQGFTIPRPLTGRPTGALTLAMALSGDVRARVTRGDQSVTVSHAGGPYLRYGGLVATDARGRALPARVEIVGTRLLLRVDDRGARYPLRIDPFVQQGGKLTGSGAITNPYLAFGDSVALSSDGNTALIGGPEDNASVGAAWVFTRSGSTWTQQGAKLTGAGGVGAGYFGSSVALSSDGNTALIGGDRDSTAVGAVWVFTRSGSTWAQQGGKLTGGGEVGYEDFELGKVNGYFGASVALSADGDTALIGGPDDNALGATWVFTRSGSTWTQQGGKLTGGEENPGPGFASGEAFGLSVALSADGNTALIGGGCRCGNSAGAAWVFTRSGSTWTQQGRKLTTEPLAQFGASVALSADGSTALIGGIFGGSPGSRGPGAAWVFTRSGSTWTQQGEKLTGSGESEILGAEFGASVALSADGNTALIGGPFDGDFIGAAWEFTRSGSTWTQQGEKLTGSGEVGVHEPYFGGSVALSADAKTALIGGPTDNSDVGAAWVFTSTSTPPSTPVVVSGAATAVSPVSATLNGTVTPGEDGVVTSCYFEYGETYNVYGFTVPCAQTVGGGTSPVPVSASLTGLTPGTTYHVRLVATSSGGTGYGSDEMFTTAGSSLPTVGTRIPFTGWPDVALLSGEINAHGNDVLYGFEYGRSYVEEHFTGWLGHVTSTSLTSVEYAQHGLQPDVRYYARLVAFYQGTTYVRGNTVSFEITPPEPEAAEAPYLEANGGDAEKGFVLRCNPGTWRNAAGFRYQWYGGSHLANTQEYGVTQSDIGHGVKCKVTPYQLDGQPDEAAALTTEPPYLPEGANDIIIPEWAKVGFAVGSAAHLGAEAGLACVVLTDGACALLIGFDLERIVLEELISSKLDPPDRNYQDIAIPASRSFPIMRRYPCARGISHRTCVTLAHLAGRYGAAAARATSVIEAFAISRNRTLIARKKKNTQALLVQAAARKVYVGLLADAFVELNSAGLAYAEALHHARLDVRIGAAASRRLANRPYTEVIGHSLLQRMLRFATRPDIKKAVEAAGRHPAAFDLQKTLRRVLPTALLERYYATLDLNDLTSLVNGLEDQRALSTTSGRRLLVDVAYARAACTQSGRKVAIEGFLRDAKPSLQTAFYSFLSSAVQPLSSGNSTVDPYPHCLS
jgi:hypothetical protein